jgi:hypothetical protein
MLLLRRSARWTERKTRKLSGPQSATSCPELLTRFPEADLLNLDPNQRGFAIERFTAIDVFRRFELDVGKTIVEKAPSVGLPHERGHERHSEDFDAILRTDLLAFAQKSVAHFNPDVRLDRTWHHEAIAYALDRVFRGECRRLIINAPPRTLKSLFGSVAFPAFVLVSDLARSSSV